MCRRKIGWSSEQRGDGAAASELCEQREGTLVLLVGLASHQLVDGKEVHSHLMCYSCLHTCLHYILVIGKNKAMSE